MGFYCERIVPRIIDWSMRNDELRPLRQRAVSGAHGRVLEIGVGSALNLPFYGPRVNEIVGLEPSERLMEMARHAAIASNAPLTLLQGSAESIPIEDGTIDTVVTTWTLCSIPDVGRALGELRRVLKPGGQLLFVEHGLAPENHVRKWQHRLAPVWKRIGGGCHLNRPIRTIIENAGFGIEHLATGYVRGPKPMTFMYEGRAVPGKSGRTSVEG